MIVNDKEALDRINSPFNLLNKLKSLNTKKDQGLDLFKNKNLALPKIETNKEVKEDNEVSIDHLIDGSDSQIKLAAAHNNALEVLNSAIAELQLNISNVKPEKLPSVITAASKVVESIRKERSEANKQNKQQGVHFHFYTPQQRQITDYEVIEVGHSAST